MLMHFLCSSIPRRHLQTKHCTRLEATTTAGQPNGGRPYVCRFGPGGTCSLIGDPQRHQQRFHDPYVDADNDDTDDDDDSANDTFEQHVLRHHLQPILPTTGATRKTSTASNRTTTSTSVEPTPSISSDTSGAAAAADWTIFSSAQNLPAVLNDPSRGKQATLFTRHWGDAFVERVSIAPSRHLAAVTHADLDAYMQRIGKRYRRHQRLQLIGVGGEAMDAGLPPPPSTGGDQIADIPAVFLQPNLALSDPATFALVFPGLESTAARPAAHNVGDGDDNDPLRPIASGGGGAARDTVVAAAAGSAARLHQHERLSHYLDVVEVHITRKVSQQSGAFFAAMTSQQTIVAEMHAAMLNVRRLRRQLAAVDATLVRDALRICAGRRRELHQRAVLHKLRIMAEVHKTQPMIQLLLGTADYVAAIDLIGSTQELLRRELADVHCLKHLPSQLSEMERLIDKMLGTEFERFAQADLNRRDGDDGGQEGAAAVVVVGDEDKLAAIVWGLLRRRHFGFIETYRDEAIVTVRALIKEMLIEVLASGDGDACLTGAGEESQALSIGEWIELLDRATVRLLRLLRRVRAVCGVMERIAAESAGRPAASATGSGEQQQVEEEAPGYYGSEAFLDQDELDDVRRRLAAVVQLVCGYCHERCATLISSQSLERTVATGGQVERLQRVVGDFAAGCEALTARANASSSGGEAAPTTSACAPLLAALQAQATRFAHKFHADRKAKLALLLDGERWRQVEVPAELQRLVDGIGGGQWSTSARRITNDVQPDERASSSSGSLLVDGDAYVLVGSALILLQIIDEYARCAVQLPVVAAQLGRHVVDLLRTFNSRSCQLVLGAGALRVAGLKTITSANLALVARALQLVVWLLPHIRGHFGRVAGGGGEMTKRAPSAATTAPVLNGNGVAHNSNQPQAMGTGYDIVERDLLSHIAEIETMILSIVTQLVVSQMDAWTARPPVPSATFRSISRHFVKLHEAVAPIMPAEQVTRIYGVLHRTFKDKLREQLVRHGVVNNGGPAHGVVTAELTFYAETVRQLGVLGGTANGRADGSDERDELSDDAMADVWRK